MINVKRSRRLCWIHLSAHYLISDQINTFSGWNCSEISFDHIKRRFFQIGNASCFRPCVYFLVSPSSINWHTSRFRQAPVSTSMFRCSCTQRNLGYEPLRQLAEKKSKRRPPPLTDDCELCLLCSPTPFHPPILLSRLHRNWLIAQNDPADPWFMIFQNANCQVSTFIGWRSYRGTKYCCQLSLFRNE